jgi:hypothetical protein
MKNLNRPPPYPKKAKPAQERGLRNSVSKEDRPKILGTQSPWKLRPVFLAEDLEHSQEES